MRWKVRSLCAAFLLLGATGQSLAARSFGAGRPPTPVRGMAVAATADRPGPEGPERPPRVGTAGAPVRSLLLASIPRNLSITARPGGGRVLGIMPAESPFFHTPTMAWIQAVSPNRRFGLVTVPFRGNQATGWISLRGLALRRTPIVVHVDLSRHLVTVTRSGRVILAFHAATGAPSSPTPPGRYFVTDRVPENPLGPYGAFAFGISGIQTHLPVGWSGGIQLAVHGTNDPATIGMSVSAGCVRVSASAVRQLEPLLRLGTPVIIER